MNKLRRHRFEIILAALVIVILVPLLATIFKVDVRFVNLFALSLLSTASLILAVRKIPRVICAAFSLSTLVSIWAEFIYPENPILSSFRMWSMLFMYITLSYILIRNFIDVKEVELSVISGAVSGFILIGIIGGTLFELLHYYVEGSILLSPESGGYDFYYYSFISLMTVGYGDIVPLTGAAKSLTILIGLTGQLYLAIGIAIFVGKHLNSKVKSN